MLGPIIALENEKRAMGIKKDSGPVTMKETISQVDVIPSQTDTPSQNPAWELPGNKRGLEIFKKLNSGGMNPPLMSEPDVVMSTDRETIKPGHGVTSPSTILHKKSSEDIKGSGRIDANELDLQKISPLRGNYERKSSKVRMSTATNLEDESPDNGLGKKVLELEDRLNQETALREQLEKRVLILEAHVRGAGQKESGEEGGFMVGSQVGYQFK